MVRRGTQRSPMTYIFERRVACNRIIGVERRGAPFSTLMGRPLPDPTRLIDEDFFNRQPPPGEKQSDDTSNEDPWRPRNQP